MEETMCPVPYLSQSRKSGFTQDIDVKSIWRAHMQPSFSFSVVMVGPFHSLLVPCSNKGGYLTGLGKWVFPVKDSDNSLDCHLLLMVVLNEVKEANLNVFLKKRD